MSNDSGLYAAIEVSGRSFRLSPPRNSDVEELLRLRNSQISLDSLTNSQLVTTETGAERWIAHYDGVGPRAWIVRSEIDGSFCGYSTLTPSSQSGHSLAFSINLVPSVTGFGLGTAVLSRVLCAGFCYLRAERIWLEVLERNDRARRVYKKAGMTEEGVLRNAAYTAGHCQDVVVMSILSAEHRCDTHIRDTV